MDEEPTSNTPSMLVKREGEIKHKLDETQKRHSRHLERQIIARELMTTPQWYYQKYATMSTTSKMAGNLNEPKTLDVLRKIKSGQLDQRNLHTDFMQEVKILQEVYQDLEPSGFINFFAYMPFQVHYFLEEQISLFSKLGKSHKGTLLFDATGSILKKALPGEEGQTLLYALVMENPVEGWGAIPIAEFITTDHHASEIRHFLDRVLVRLKSFSRTLQIRQIETDFSWTMLQAVVGATNKHDLSQYIEWCWAVVCKEKSCAEIRKKNIPTYLFGPHDQNFQSILFINRKFRLKSERLSYEMSCCTGWLYLCYGSRRFVPPHVWSVPNTNWNKRLQWPSGSITKQNIRTLGRYHRKRWWNPWWWGRWEYWRTFTGHQIPEILQKHLQPNWN